MIRILPTARLIRPLLLAAAVLVAACAQSPAVATPSAAVTPLGSSPPSTAAPSGPVATPPADATASAVATLSAVASSPPPTVPLVPTGIIALGHSALTGEGTGASSVALYENSWATGTAEDVDSIYLRLVANEPATQGWVSNAARGGADVNALTRQAQAALQQVPNPELMIIQTIDNDIRCDGTDADNVPRFGTALEGVLQQLTAAAPAAHILLVGQRGRPSVDFARTLLTAHPDLQPYFNGAGPCDLFGPTGSMKPERFGPLTEIIDSYEGEQARVCAGFMQCRTDNGVLATQFVEQLDYYTSDFSHLNVLGQARMAELVWPIVAALLAP